jgi:alpha-glucosidase
MRPLVLEFPDDPRTYGLDDQFMFGRDLLIAPVLREAERTREVYLPKGEWFDFWTGRRYEGGAAVRIPVTLESTPIFVRGGGFVFRQPVIQHTGEMPGQPLEVHVYPAARSEATLYEDDGETLEYRQNAFVRRTFTATRSGAGTASIDVAAPEGSWRPKARGLVFAVHWEGEPGRVTSGGTMLTRYKPEEFAGQATGWTIAEPGVVLVKQPDRFEALRVVIEG